MICLLVFAGFPAYDEYSENNNLVMGIIKNHQMPHNIPRSNHYATEFHCCNRGNFVRLMVFLVFLMVFLLFLPTLFHAAQSSSIKNILSSSRMSSSSTKVLTIFITPCISPFSL
mmetsp:Transcript_15021/g.22176  ORF Transcript_15021/g.22176 Transcript_15021/m.22176 type:complete len:114 (-) Transcript_15021:503-844(-)